MKNKELKILLSAPRGFCAGVERAIEIVEKSIQKFGAPVYVRHEIVHNKYVVDDLKNKGAIFVEELELSLIHICRCRRLLTCRSRWSPYH